MPEKILYFLADLLPLVDANTATIIDVRSPGAYQRGHIPGAVNIPEVFTYLLPESSDQGLADMASYFAGLFATAGVERHRPVLFYEDNLASQFGGACRGYWLLTYLGHPSAGVLADGLQGWQQAGHALETVTPRPAPGHFTAAPRPEMIASERDVLQAIATIETILLDDRDEQEWLGLSSSPYDLDFAPRKGKIPS